MPTLSLASDIKEVSKQLDMLHRKQIPYAASLALNDVAFEGRKAEVNAQSRYLDRPVRFTQTGFRVIKAKKNNLTAIIEVPPNRWKYVKHQVEGSASMKSKGFHAIPVDDSIKNKYGGMARNKVRSLSKKKGHFFGAYKGNNYLWKRTSNKSYPIEPLVLFEKTTQQRKIYPIWKAATRVVEKRFEHKFADRLAYAIRTARKPKGSLSAGLKLGSKI